MICEKHPGIIPPAPYVTSAMTKRHPETWFEISGCRFFSEYYLHRPTPLRRHPAEWRELSAIYMPASIIAEPSRNHGVITSPSSHHAKTIVVTGLK